MRPLPGTLGELISQHDGLRALMDECEDEADRVDADPAADPAPLVHLLARLRAAFEAHNLFEEQLLRPVLLESDEFGAVRVDRMVDDHVHEHRAMAHRLGAPAVAELRDVIETLRAHLEAEERYLLTARVLRED